MGQLDMRMISLHSRDSRQEGFTGLAGGQYYSFCYYDAIEVEPDWKGSPLRDLLSGYEAVAARRKEPGLYAFRQFLLAIADIRKEGEPSGSGCCYTEGEISEFWRNGAGYPLFFVTMITLRDSRRLEDALAEIRDIFPKGQYLAYLTFDHCDILLFYRDRGFTGYADKIFRLNYGTELLEDSITLCSFAAENMDKGLTGEKFDVYLRFGVRDYDRAAAFVSSYEMEKTVDVGRLLGRNDIGLLRRDADFAWLNGLIRDTLEPSPRWYTTYDLSILIRRPDGQRPGRPDWLFLQPSRGPAAPAGAAADVMKRATEDFLSAYEGNAMGLKQDPVWINWLEKAGGLAAALYENPLAADFGTCLVPQFLDLFTYMGRLLRNQKLTNADVDSVRRIFSVFFSSTSILMDGINHSSRQFVQVPSFSPVSFEMPPRLMAYYTALAHRLIEVFRDGEETYGVAFCPEFVQTLEVTSYASQALSKDEWLTISIDERSLYTLRLTTQTIGHEISHFVGNKNRCRKDRERLTMKTALAGLLESLLAQVGQALGERFGDTEAFRKKIRWEDVSSCTDSLLETLQKLRLPEQSEKGRYSRQVRERVINLPNAILCVPALSGEIEKWLCQALLNREDQGDALARLKNHLSGELRGASDAPPSRSDMMDPVYRNMAAGEIRREMFRALEQQSAYNWAVEVGREKPLYREDPPWVTADHICYMFSEAFADLQMILLFRLTWDDYRALLMQDGNRLPAKDCPPRMLAVARALTEAGHWKADAIRTEDCADERLREIGDAVRLSLPEEAARLQKLGFEVALTVHLSEYLKLCCGRIQASLEKKREAAEELRGIHGLLSMESPVYELERGLVRFIQNYRAGLEKGQGLLS